MLNLAPTYDSARGKPPTNDCRSFWLFKGHACADRFSVYDGRGGRPACDLRKLAYRYRRVRDIYAQRREGTMNRKILAELIDAYQQTDAFSNGWLSLAKRMLHKVSLIPGAVNIVVSACQLTPTLAKSLVYQVSVMAYSCNPYGKSLVQL